jgi:Collagen triple helix repeat (20 copies)
MELASFALKPSAVAFPATASTAPLRRVGKDRVVGVPGQSQRLLLSIARLVQTSPPGNVVPQQVRAMSNRLSGNIAQWCALGALAIAGLYFFSKLQQRVDGSEQALKALQLQSSTSVEKVNQISAALGPVGPTGVTGDRGPTGATGEPGPRGPAGAAGERGPIGPPGSAAQQGPVGPSGPAGEKGPNGDPGINPDQLAELEKRIAALERRAPAILDVLGDRQRHIRHAGRILIVKRSIAHEDHAHHHPHGLFAFRKTRTIWLPYHAGMRIRSTFKFVACRERYSSHRGQRYGV